MPQRNLRQQLAESRTTIEALHEELVETNRGMIALAAELEAKNEETANMSQQLWQTAKLATMGELAASIAHELNNPLAIVRLRVESLLGQVPADDSKYRALTVIDRETARMADLVAQLLQFGRKSEPQISTIAICDEIEATLSLVHYHLRNHNVTVIRDYANQIPMILADRQLMHQVFLNLFNNACDAMSGGGTLTIRVRENRPPATGKAGDPHSILEILVEDTGEGIAPENLPRVMEVFFTTKPPGKGTGLGLSICRRAVEEFGGRITLASELGKGTAVSIVFPLPQKSSPAGKTNIRWE